jgi:hypothetical protein
MHQALEVDIPRAGLEIEVAPAVVFGGGGLRGWGRGVWFLLLRLEGGRLSSLGGTFRIRFRGNLADGEEKSRPAQ